MRRFEPPVADASMADGDILQTQLPLAADFLRRVFDVGPGDVTLGDDTLLRDFAGCNLPIAIADSIVECDPPFSSEDESEALWLAWREWLGAKVLLEYGVRADADDLLRDVLERIERRRTRRPRDTLGPDLRRLN